MKTIDKHRYAELRELFGKVFDAQWSRDELENYDQLRGKFLFHMTDAIDDVTALADLYRNSDPSDEDLARRVATRFFVHAVPHLLAAGQINDFVPDTFEEQRGVHWKISDYALPLLELHRLIAQGKGDTDAADAVRDRMDAPWRKLSRCDLELVRGLSSDLNSMGIDRSPPTADPPSSELANFRACVETRDWAGALDSVRTNEQHLTPDTVAFIRGACWAQLGEPDVAVEFFQGLRRLRQLQESEILWLLTCLLQAHRHDEAVSFVETLDIDFASPKLLLKSAEVYSMLVTDQDEQDAESTRLRAIDLAKQGLRDAHQVSGDLELDAILPTAYLHLAMNYAEMDNIEDAIKACRTALQLEPDRVDAKQILAFLEDEGSHLRSDSAKRNDFRYLLMAPLPESSLETSLCGIT